MSGNSLDQLALQKPARHTERTESRTEQHCRDATVRNPDTGRAKKRPFSEAAQVKDSRNRYDPMQVTDVPRPRHLARCNSQTSSANATGTKVYRCARTI